MLAAATETINEDGLTNASLELVASKLSLNKTSLYYYFKNKEELVYRCYVRACEIGRRHAEEAVRAGGSGREKFERYIRMQLNDDGPLVAFVSDTTLLTNRHRAEILRLAREHDAFVRSILEDGVRDGSLVLADAHLTSLAVIGALNWTLTWWRPGRGPLKASDIGEAFLDIFLHGLRPAGRPLKRWPQPVPMPDTAAHTRNAFSRAFQVRLKREAVFQAASMFFNRNGYDNANLEQIVDHLGVSKGALYHYVSSKEELLYGCYSRSLDLMEGVLEAIDDTPDDGLTQVLRYIGSMLELHAGSLGPLANFSRLKSLTAGHQKEVRRRSERLQKFTDGMLERGVADGSIRPHDVRLARLAIIGAVNWVPKWYQASGSNTVAEISSAFSALFANGLTPRG